LPGPRSWEGRASGLSDGARPPHRDDQEGVYDAFGRGEVPTILDAVFDDVDWATETTSTAAPWYQDELRTCERRSCPDEALHQQAGAEIAIDRADRVAAFGPREAVIRFVIQRASTRDDASADGGRTRRLSAAQRRCASLPGRAIGKFNIIELIK
jgi:hypothetical protein